MRMMVLPRVASVCEEIREHHVSSDRRANLGATVGRVRAGQGGSGLGDRVPVDGDLDGRERRAGRTGLRRTVVEGELAAVAGARDVALGARLDEAALMSA